jgi:hypothetical protein
MESSPSHKLTGLHGLLQGSPYFFITFIVNSSTIFELVYPTFSNRVLYDHNKLEGEGFRVYSPLTVLPSLLRSSDVHFFLFSLQVAFNANSSNAILDLVLIMQ